MKKIWVWVLRVVVAVLAYVAVTQFLNSPAGRKLLVRKEQKELKLLDKVTATEKEVDAAIKKAQTEVFSESKQATIDRFNDLFNIPARS